jgi:hypothetical protein
LAATNIENEVELASRQMQVVKDKSREVFAERRKSAILEE